MHKNSLTFVIVFDHAKSMCLLVKIHNKDGSIHISASSTLKMIKSRRPRLEIKEEDLWGGLKPVLRSWGGQNEAQIDLVLLSPRFGHQP